MSQAQRKYMCHHAPGNDERAKGSPRQIIVSWRGTYGREQAYVDILDDGRMFCCSCSGRNKAQLTSCRHIAAIRRAPCIYPAMLL